MATRKAAVKRPFDVDALWQLDRLGAPSLSSDGAQAVASITRYSMGENRGETSLWLFSTLGGAPRRLTAAGDKDGQPQWSPSTDEHAERIAFVARREQEGKKDEQAQLYLINADGGEARRVTSVATGVDCFKWFPDGRRIAFVSWVWPNLVGAEAHADAAKALKERKETAYVTSESLYRWWDRNLPMDRVPHLHVLDVETGKIRDLFEGTPYELTRTDVGTDAFDIAPDGKRIVFAFDPAPEKRSDGRYALAEIEVRSASVRVLLQNAEWDFGAPSYSHGGTHLAFTASHKARGHNMPSWAAVLDGKGRWATFSEDFDQSVSAPLVWTEDDEALLFGAEETGRRHLWRLDLGSREVARVFEGGNVTSFSQAAGVLVVNHDSVQHPPRLSARVLDAPWDRIDRCNDELLAKHEFGRHEEVFFKGAAGDAVQMWLVYPPGFDPKKKYPLLHLIHGGPHTAFGDSWHWRWNHQVFAAQGYVLANVNYHGSSSFGHAFLDSITHRWGELELQDIEAATTLLLKKPWADKRRVFASGGSYGGYMVAWMNGHVKPGRYQAYVCHAGCFDWQAMFSDDAYRWHVKELGAWYWEQPQKVAAQSPHAYAGHMKTPTIVIHGAQDYRVPDAQGLAYYNTLKARGVDARLVWFPDENHWVLKPRNSKLWYGEFLGWLKRYDPAAPKG